MSSTCTGHCDVSEFTAVRAEYAHFSPEGHLGIFSVYDIKRGENHRDAQGEGSYCMCACFSVFYPFVTRTFLNLMVILGP